MSDLTSVTFKDLDPTLHEIEHLRMDIDADLPGPLLESVRW